MLRHVNKLLALGALGGAGVFVLIWLVLFWITRPSPYAGLDGTMRFLTLFTTGGAVLAIVLLHLVLGHQLWHGERR